MAPVENPQEELAGSFLRESGCRGPGLADRTLQAMPLPNSRHVDRSSGAEFHCFSELCRLLASFTGRQVFGVVSLCTSTSPCLSCVGTFRQFQVLYPDINIDVCELEDLEVAGKSIGAGARALQQIHINLRDLIAWQMIVVPPCKDPPFLRRPFELCG